MNDLFAVFADSFTTLLFDTIASLLLTPLTALASGLFTSIVNAITSISL